MHSEAKIAALAFRSTLLHILSQGQTVDSILLKRFVQSRSILLSRLSVFLEQRVTHIQ